MGVGGGGGDVGDEGGGGGCGWWLDAGDGTSHSNGEWALEWGTQNQEIYSQSFQKIIVILFVRCKQTFKNLVCLFVLMPNDW